MPICASFPCPNHDHARSRSNARLLTEPETAPASRKSTCALVRIEWPSKRRNALTPADSGQSVARPLLSCRRCAANSRCVKPRYVYARIDWMVIGTWALAIIAFGSFCVKYGGTGSFSNSPYTASGLVGGSLTRAPARHSSRSPTTRCYGRSESLSESPSERSESQIRKRSESLTSDPKVPAPT
jgi:hypothetical protein